LIASKWRRTSLSGSKRRITSVLIRMRVTPRTASAAISPPISRIAVRLRIAKSAARRATFSNPSPSGLLEIRGTGIRQSAAGAKVRETTTVTTTPAVVKSPNSRIAPSGLVARERKPAPVVTPARTTGSDTCCRASRTVPRRSAWASPWRSMSWYSATTCTA
jgi:hypothetical protein